MNSPRFFLTLGIVLMIVGVVLPFLIIIKILESTFFLNFLSWSVSVAGLMMGMMGIAGYSGGRKN
jgi:hypothetical protein